jgi:hypothetical protein
MFLMDNDEWFSIRMVLLSTRVLADELNIVVHSDYLAPCVGLDVSLRNLS